MTRVRIRGIYTTALTQLFVENDDIDVVGASSPIERRFDDDFTLAEHDVAIETSGDRQGVGIIGEPAAVATISDRIESTGIDTLTWEDSAPRTAVFDAEVVDTLGRGAVVVLGEDGREGFLPYDATDDHIVEGDRLTVQVHEPEPPWSDRRPRVDTDIEVFGGIAGLVRGAERTVVETPEAERASELVGMTDLLSVDVPDGWGIRWQAAAGDADMHTLEAALERVVTRVEAVEAALDEGGQPEATVWAWFGRESRFALDESRRTVTATMPGHHRIKAAHESAGSAVDFVERVCDLSGDADGFPFVAVSRQFGPLLGDTVRIDHGKPEGERFALGRGEIVDWNEDGTITVRREMTPGGEYDALGVPREEGDVALTKFTEGRWWYPTVYRNSDGDRKGTYVNICTPVELFPEAATYVDLHVDVVRHADGSVERVDDDELDAAVENGHVSEPLAEKARAVAAAVERGLN